MKKVDVVTNLAQNLVTSAHTSPDRIAVRQGEIALTYAELNQRSADVAALLADSGVTAGSRVAIMLPNILAFPTVYYAALRLGAIVVPFNPLLKEREVSHLLQDSGATVLVAAAAPAEIRQAAHAATTAVLDLDDVTAAAATGNPNHVVPRAASDTAALIYTSGTTGSPKGAELTHGNVVDNTDTIANSLFHLTEEDVIFGGLPLFHVFGQTCGMNATIAAGATLTLLPRFDPSEAMSILLEHDVTVLLGVPTMLGALLSVSSQFDRSASRLRLVGSGGASLPVEVLRAFENTYGVPVLEGYGLSETSPVASFNHLDRPAKPGSIGTPVRGVEMAIVDASGATLPTGEIGEIVVRGPNVMKGYWNRPDATAEAIQDGWFHTGDLGRVDEDGYFYVVDRKKDMIIRGGYNIYPREIEEVLYEHPAVREAAVIGIADPTWGEEIAAIISTKPGETVTPDDITDYVKQRVAPYKYPRQVWITDDLPKGPTGKILKRQIDLDLLSTL